MPQLNYHQYLDRKKTEIFILPDEEKKKKER